MVAKKKRESGTPARRGAGPTPTPSASSQSNFDRATQPRARRRNIGIASAVIVSTILAGAFAIWAQRDRPSSVTARTSTPPPAEQRYVGRAECATCHAREDAAW